MQILIVVPSPAAPNAVAGNDVTARRWEGIFRGLGHGVQVIQAYTGQRGDVLVALHARKSASAVREFKKLFPNRPILVALTGTDLYQDLPEGDEETRASLQAATHLIVLQPGALESLEPPLRRKTTVIYQSANPMPPIAKAANCFQVCLVAHLRHVKDPFLAASAVKRMASDSKLQVVHAGEALTEEMGRRAEELSETSSRYRWLGPLPHEEARLLIARSHLLVLTSRAEGGANVVSEALAARVPVVASRVAGVEGLLGPDYPGFFPVGDASALARLLGRAESDEVFYRRLQRACRKLAPLVEPALERKSWQQLLSICQ